ncbi:ABC transporter substrate-binding protein [Xinfangfangia sp. CPCC 101601]|uniref:ABC transporter substrate-binding protein n=1 Tax=Pseudogemmobacter lacusdianii TaxID=3069608 RepID=A0ABU0W1M0_9RHOB|nr:ABC transporter substrate-binding protein [Xinfangfangia sp. CPCC 101601]MDQ2067917.1 ABC transporter substrate-binding protein [Xinfangfangia sp. CPCC 101601]
MNKVCGLSRRGFLQSAGVTALMAAAPMAAFAQSGPKRGGTLAIGIEGASTGDSLDPRSFNSPYWGVVSGTIFNTLVEIYGPSNELRPGLAKSWEESEGGKRWTFDLVEGATFHDGRPVTSADVIYSIMFHDAEDSRSNSRAIAASVAEAKAESPTRVVFDLKEANYFFPAMLSNYPLCIIPEGTTTFDGIGSGPYKITRFSPGEMIEAVRHEGYFKTDAAWVDQVVILAANDPAARASAFQSGQLHIASMLESRTAALLGQLPGKQVHSYQTSQFAGFNLRADSAPFDNADLRMALKLAIDREDILARVYGGLGRIGNDTPIPPNDPLFAADIPQNSYDPEKAAEYFKKSGFTGTLTLQTSEAASAAAVDMAALFREHAAKAGITIDVVREPADGYWSNVWGQTAFHSTLWGARPTADMILTTAYTSGSPGNDTHWSNADFDAAVTAARAEPDEAKRRAYYTEAQRILSSDGGVIVPVFGDVVEGLSVEVQGYVTGTQPLANYRAAEQVWFA